MDDNILVLSRPNLRISSLLLENLISDKWKEVCLRYRQHKYVRNSK